MATWNINGVRFGIFDIVGEIKSQRSANFKKREVLELPDVRVFRFHFSAPLKTADKIGDFFGVEVHTESDFNYYIDFYKPRGKNG